MEMRPRKLESSSIAAFLSVLLHLLVLASGMWWSTQTPAPRRPVEILLIPLSTPQPTPLEPPPRPVRDSPSIEPRPAEGITPLRPLLASLTISRRSSVTPTSIEPSSVEPGVEPVVEPSEPTLVDVPEPREAALRETVRELPPPATEGEVIEGRVAKMLQESLRPRLNDSALMPDLHPDGQGNLVYENGALRALISPDGTVSFRRHRGASIDGLPGSKSPDPEEQEILDLYTRIPGVPLTVRRASAAECAAGPCEDKAGLGVTLRPHSDLNDAILRARGEDPLAARKRRFLRLTRELRDGLATKSQKRSARHAKLRAGRHLERLWSDGSLGFAAKRLRLFRLWDECDEVVEGGDERPEAAAGQRARSHILSFIRQRLPRDGPTAYSTNELRGFNGTRESLQPFAPYLGF